MCNKQMSNIPEACPDCGSTPRQARRFARFGIALTAAALAAIVVTFAETQSSVKHASAVRAQKQIASALLDNNEKQVDAHSHFCDEQAPTDFRASPSFSRQCAKVIPNALDTALNTQPFAREELDSAINTAK